MQIQYVIYFYFHDFKHAIEDNEFGHNDRDNDDERKEGIEEELNCKFIRINSDEGNFNEKKKAINEIERHIIKSSKKSLTENFSKRLLELEFKSNH